MGKRVMDKACEGKGRIVIGCERQGRERTDHEGTDREGDGRIDGKREGTGWEKGSALEEKEGKERRARNGRRKDRR